MCSNWEQPGMLYGKPAMQCSKQEIIAEVWAQPKAHLDLGGAGPLQDGDRVGWFVDSDIRYPNPRQDIDLQTPARQHRRFLGPPARPRPRRSRTSSSPVTTSGPTPTWRPWRGPTRPLAGPLTPSSTPRGPGSPSAGSGPYTSRRCSPRSTPWTTVPAISGSTGHPPGVGQTRGQASDPRLSGRTAPPTFPALAVGTSSAGSEPVLFGNSAHTGEG